jgi:hypothetical protein
MRSFLFMIAIVGAAFLLIGFVITHGLKATANRARPAVTHTTVCQPGPVPQC